MIVVVSMWTVSSSDLPALPEDPLVLTKKLESGLSALLPWGRDMLASSSPALPDLPSANMAMRRSALLSDLPVCAFMLMLASSSLLDLPDLPESITGSTCNFVVTDLPDLLPPLDSASLMDLPWRFNRRTEYWYDLLSQDCLFRSVQ